MTGLYLVMDDIRKNEAQIEEIKAQSGGEESDRLGNIRQKFMKDYSNILKDKLKEKLESHSNFTDTNNGDNPKINDEEIEYDIIELHKLITVALRIIKLHEQEEKGALEEMRKMVEEYREEYVDKHLSIFNDIDNSGIEVNKDELLFGFLSHIQDTHCTRTKTKKKIKELKKKLRAAEEDNLSDGDSQSQYSKEFLPTDFDIGFFKLPIEQQIYSIEVLNKYDGIINSINDLYSAMDNIWKSEKKAQSGGEESYKLFNRRQKTWKDYSNNLRGELKEKLESYSNFMDTNNGDNPKINHKETEYAITESHQICTLALRIIKLHEQKEKGALEEIRKMKEEYADKFSFLFNDIDNSGIEFNKDKLLFGFLSHINEHSYGQLTRAQNEVKELKKKLRAAGDDDLSDDDSQS